MNENSLTVMPPDGGSEYPLLRLGTARELLSVFRDNLGSEGLSPQNLQRIKVPAGGLLHWQVATPEGEEMLKEIEGIILAWRPARLYWKKSMDEGGGKKPPDCVSKDAFIGVGDPGGHCNVCPNAQFGTSQKGHGQACKQVRQMLVVLPGETLPHLISIPPTSLKPAGQYFMMLLGRAIPYWAVTTKLRLEKATNEGGIAYAKVQFFQGRVLSPQERELLGPYHEQMQKMLDPIAIDSRDYATGPDVNLDSPTTHGIFNKPRPVEKDPDPPFYSGAAERDPKPAQRDFTDDSDVPF